MYFSAYPIWPLAVGSKNTDTGKCCKRTIEESLEKNKSNLKKCWDVLREAIRKKNDKSGDIEELKINGNTIKDGLDIATSFNNYFTTIADSIAADINPTDRPPDELMEQSNCQWNM